MLRCLICQPVRAALQCVASAAICAAFVHAQVPTSQYDNARTGSYLNEKQLTPANVNQRQFGKVFSFQVDGDVYAQPLYMASVPVPGKGTHNLLFIATEHDSVYAFDADGKQSEPLWHVSFLAPGLTTGSTPVPAADVACPFITPEVGITSTPVIDTHTGTLYVLARTKDSTGLFSSRYVQRLHALAVTTGVEKFGGPVEIHASVPGKGEGSANGRLAFDSLRENPRAALLLSGGSVYLSWASSCDVGPYHGWIMAYDAGTLKQQGVFNTSPDADDSGIWAGDTGPAADSAGNVFVATGNGAFDAASGGRDFGDSMLQLSAHALQLRDYFTPYDQGALNDNDNDLGSGGPVLLSDQPGKHPHMLVIAGKGGRIYLIDRDLMGKFHAERDAHALQTIDVKGGVFGSMAWWNSNLFVLASDDVLRDYEMKDGQLSLKASAMGAAFIDPGATPTVSADGNRNGIVWVIASKGWRSPDRAAVLHAYDAANVARELYASDQNGGRDGAGKALRFAIPTVVNGRVYVGTKKEVDVYGLLPSR
jgi:hypothetical protein